MSEIKRTLTQRAPAWQREACGSGGIIGGEPRRAGAADVVAIQQRLEALKDGGVSGLRQKAKQLAIALEEAAQGARDGKGPVAMGDGSEDLGCDLFGKEDRALGLATGAEIPGTAGKRQQVLSMTLWAPNAGEAPLKPATGQKLLHGMNHDRAQGSRMGLEAFLIAPNIAVEVVFKELIELSLLGMSWPIFRNRLRNDPTGEIAGREARVFGCKGPNNDRLATQWHDRWQTSRGCRAAIDLTAATGSEPDFLSKEGGAYRRRPARSCRIPDLRPAWRQPSASRV
jgi:hypothetical protein